MPVGLLTLELHIPDAQSLKDKRQVLRSLKDKLRREFNVAVAETLSAQPTPKDRERFPQTRADARNVVAILKRAGVAPPPMRGGKLPTK